MKFNDFIEVGAIKANLVAEGKEAAIEELIGCLVAAGGIQADEQKSIVDAVMKREELGSTGIGRGVAVPHTKHPSVDRLIGTVGISHDGVDFSLGGGEAVQFSESGFKLLALIAQILQAAIDEFPVVGREVVQQVVDDAADAILLLLRPRAGGHQLLVIASHLFPDDGDDLLASALV